MLMYLLALEFCQCIRFCINNEQILMGRYYSKTTTLCFWAHSDTADWLSADGFIHLSNMSLLNPYCAPGARLWDTRWPKHPDSTARSRGRKEHNFFWTSTSSHLKWWFFVLCHGRLALLMGSWVEVTSESGCNSTCLWLSTWAVSDQDKMDVREPPLREMVSVLISTFTSSRWK